MKDNYLFVYGTLRPTSEQTQRGSRYPHVGRALAKGQLYKVSGWYPGALFDETSPDVIVGDVLEIAPADLPRLDGYEGYNARTPDSPDNLYRRIPVEVTLQDEGQRIKCWTYEYNQSIHDDTLIPSGDFLNG